MSEYGSLPQWAEKYFVPDTFFQSGYEALGTHGRAWVKKTIAQTYALYHATGCTKTATETAYSQNFRIFLGYTYPKTALLVLSGCVSPAKAVAAAVPLLLCGAEEVCAVLTGEGLEKETVAAALELAGVQIVLELDSKQLPQLFQTVFSVVVFLGQDLSLAGTLHVSKNIFTLHLPVCSRFAVAGQRSVQWDFSAITAIHAGAVGDIWVEGDTGLHLPDGFHSHTGTREDMALAGYDVLYVPHNEADFFSGRAARIFTPGQEGCWVWPELYKQNFCTVSMSIADQK